MNDRKLHLRNGDVLLAPARHGVKMSLEEAGELGRLLSMAVKICDKQGGVGSYWQLVDAWKKCQASVHVPRNAALGRGCALPIGSKGLYLKYTNIRCPNSFGEWQLLRIDEVGYCTSTGLVMGGRKRVSYLPSFP